MSNLIETPVLLLTGYLGSGKTTLLNRILSNEKGIKFAVIVNDIGEVNIDATLIQQGGVVNQQEVAVGFQVDLVHIQLTGNGLPGRLEPLRVFHLFYLVRPYVHGNFEIHVMRPGGNGQNQESEKDQVQDSSHNGNRRMPFPVRAASTGNKDNNYL